MDIYQYLTALNANTDSLLELVGKYSADKILFKNPEECSIADLLEHICISDERTISLLQSKSVYIAETSELYGDEKLKKIVVDYKGGPRITENEIKELRGAIKDFSSFEKVFSFQRNRLNDSLKSGQITITNQTYEHLYLKTMTVSDWLKYVIYHTTRHINDIKDSELAFKKLV